MRDQPDTSSRHIHIGTAGWSIPGACVDRFPGTGTHLHRYARRMTCVEINSTFYRAHRPSTYARWAHSTPSGFAFALKVPRSITHEHRLLDARGALAQFLDETSGLEDKRGPLLVQLPPSLEFAPRVAADFFGSLRTCYDGFVVCEPRHATWFTAPAEALLMEHRVARVAADPPRAESGGSPAGWAEIAYYRLHGRPRTYWTRYDSNYLHGLADVLRKPTAAAETWCVFDNTASGAALENAEELQMLL
ncbi:MAG: DUF72 domain-containing protein [Acidobacteriota bacterium]